MDWSASSKDDGVSSSVQPNPPEQLVQGLPPAHADADHSGGPREQDVQHAYLQSLLQTYNLAGQPGATVLAPNQGVQFLGQQPKRAESGDAAMQSLLQSTLTAALANTATCLPSLNLAQPTHLAMVQQQQQAIPTVAATDAVQLAALLAAMQDSQAAAGTSRLHTGRTSYQAGNLLGTDPSGRISKPSSSGEQIGGGYSAREKNRQAQQRFRQRQKDRIKELEDITRMLKEQVAERDQRLAELAEENKILRAKLEGKLQLLESFQVAAQQQQLAGAGDAQGAAAAAAAAATAALGQQLPPSVA